MDTKEKRDDRPARSEDQNLTLSSDRVLRDMGLEGTHVIGMDALGRHQMNPLLLSRIAERVLFDGDLPELRSGPLPEEASPAVPVRTESTSSRMIAAELEVASQNVLRRLTASQSALNRERLQLQRDTAIVRVGDGEEKTPAIFHESAPGAAIAGYSPGKAPDLAEVRISPLTAQQSSQRSIWKVLSTTQGRKSVADVVERRLVDTFDCDRRRGGKPDYQWEWTSKLDDAAVSNPNFDVAETILRVFEKNIRPHSENVQAISIQPINTIHERVVGWSCHLFLTNAQP